MTPTTQRSSLLVALCLALLAAAGPNACKEGGDAEGTAESPSAESSPSAGSDGAEEDEDPESETSEADSTDAGGDKQAAADRRPRLLRGRVNPGRVTEVYPRWRKRLQRIEVRKEDARALGDVPPGAEVTVYFGTWCSDSRREVPRLWKALESAGGDVPFSVDYIALDHDFSAGEDVSIEGENVQFVPTFVVERDGSEVGRIVESAPDKLERDLHALLAGDKEGVLSRRDDL